MKRPRPRDIWVAAALCGGLAIFSAAQAARKPSACLPGLCMPGEKTGGAGMACPVARVPKEEIARVYGRIQFVTALPDYRVKIVENLADLNVRIVSSMPNRPGEWQIVDSLPDYKIQIVDSLPDFTVKFTGSMPGPR